MHREEDQTPAPSMRTIPPAVPSVPDPPRQESSWIWALATIGIMASAPFLLRHVASIAQPELGSDREAVAAAGDFQPSADSNLRTAVVREARRELGADRATEEQPRTVALIPSEAVTRVEGKPMVFVAEPDLHLLVATPVELGAAEGTDVRVLSGLSVGQIVVTEDVASLGKLAKR